MKSYCFLFCLAFMLVGCDLLSKGDLEKQYPTIIRKKSSQEQRALREQFKKANPHYCPAINEYGLNESDFCQREILRVEIKDDEEDRLIKMAKDFLERNQRFINVFDTEQLEILKSHGLSGCLKCDGSEDDRGTISWIIIFKNQVYKGLEVEDTGIGVFLDTEKVIRAYGHWYKNIFIPAEDRLDFEDAKDTLIGKEFFYSDWTGRHSYIITEDSFGEYENKVIKPYETERGLELRVCLVVSAGIWNFYVDSTTGELILKDQLIVF